MSALQMLPALICFSFGIFLMIGMFVGLIATELGCDQITHRILKISKRMAWIILTPVAISMIYMVCQLWLIIFLEFMSKL